LDALEQPCLQSWVSSLHILLFCSSGIFYTRSTIEKSGLARSQDRPEDCEKNREHNRQYGAICLFTFSLSLNYIIIVLI
jgi:hypothetical protein